MNPWAEAGRRWWLGRSVTPSAGVRLRVRREIVACGHLCQIAQDHMKATSVCRDCHTQYAQVPSAHSGCHVVELQSQGHRCEYRYHSALSKLSKTQHCHRSHTTTANSARWRSLPPSPVCYPFASPWPSLAIVTCSVARRNRSSSRLRLHTRQHKHACAPRVGTPQNNVTASRPVWPPKCSTSNTTTSPACRLCPRAVRVPPRNAGQAPTPLASLSVTIISLARFSLSLPARSSLRLCRSLS